MSGSGAAAKSEIPLTLRLSKVFADPLRMKILAELNMREMSPKQFFETFGGDSLPRVSRHFDVLVAYGWLYLVHTKSGGRRRGGVEHFYKATEPAILDEDLWPRVPDSMKELVSWRILETLAEQVKEAMEAGTFDARVERHFTWTPLRLDEQGWNTVISSLDGFFEFLFKEQERANVRLSESGEDAIPMTVALAGFESPETSKRSPWHTA